MRRLLSLTLLIIFVFSCAFSAFAIPISDYDTNNEGFNEKSTWEFSELEVYAQISTMTIDELVDAGFTREQIAAYRSVKYEEILLERSRYSYEHLVALGYTDEQIRILKEYDGSPITTESAILAVSSVCTGDFDFNTYNPNTSALKFTYDFTWSSAPLASFTDVMAVNWVAVNPNAAFISVSANFRYAHLSYYSTTTGAFVQIESPTIRAMPGFNGYYVQYDPIIVCEEQADGSTVAWAKRGTMTFELTPDGNSTIHLIKAYGAVGHQTFTISGSIGFTPGTSGSWSFSVTPAATRETVGTDNVTIYSNGDVIDND